MSCLMQFERNRKCSALIMLSILLATATRKSVQMNFVLKVHFLRELTTSNIISKFMTHFRNYDTGKYDFVVLPEFLFHVGKCILFWSNKCRTSCSGVLGSLHLWVHRFPLRKFAKLLRTAIDMVPTDQFSDMQSCSNPQMFWMRIILHFKELFFMHHLISLPSSLIKCKRINYN